MNVPKISNEDRAAGFKEVQVAMMDGRLEIVCVTAPPVEKLREIMAQKMSAKLVYDFVGIVSGKDLEFILEMAPVSLTQIFVIVADLMEKGDTVRQAAITTGLSMLESVKTYGT